MARASDSFPMNNVAIPKSSGQWWNNASIQVRREAPDASEPPPPQGNYQAPKVKPAWSSIYVNVTASVAVGGPSCTAAGPWIPAASKAATQAGWTVAATPVTNGPGKLTLHGPNSVVTPPMDYWDWGWAVNQGKTALVVTLQKGFAHESRVYRPRLTGCDQVAQQDSITKPSLADWVFSPCGGLVAYTPGNPGVEPLRIWSFDISDGVFRLSPGTEWTGPARSGELLKSLEHDGSGIRATLYSSAQGPGGIALTHVASDPPTSTIDNPEYLIGRGASVGVNIVAASTMPEAASNTKLVGASVTAVPTNGSIWVQLPKVQFEKPAGNVDHWCVLAMVGAPPADYSQGGWTSFDPNDTHCAQRNVIVDTSA